jgi:hypothetical protein
MLYDIAEGLWGSDDRLEASGGLMHFPLRMVIVRLSDGSLLLHSPIAISDALHEELNRLGPVSTIVAPNGWHHVHVTAALKRFPEATVHVAKALPTKIPALAGHPILDVDTPCPFAPALQWAPIAGAKKVEEVVFHHAATRTLICTDLVFNMHETTGAMTPWILRMAGAHGRLAQSRLWRMFVDDRAAAGASVRTVLDTWEIDRIVMSHGEIYEGPDAKQVLERGVAWMLAAT